MKISANKSLIFLPDADISGISLEAALRKRRSVRAFTSTPLDLKDISNLLFAAQGVTYDMRGLKMRAAPSAGALYPIETYLIAHNVEGLASGLYRYRPKRHRLVGIKEGDYRKPLMDAAYMEETLGDAGAVIALAAVPRRITSKYKERGARFLYIEAGHIAQNVLLEAVSLGLGAVPIGGFSDETMDRVLGIDGKDEMSVYLIAVGKPLES